jgi:4-aminobutyrate aminotransferase / (S)-3-amino-2-methylpropionate transaminase / 5-aminovalerate transaminase
MTTQTGSETGAHRVDDGSDDGPWQRRLLTEVPGPRSRAQVDTLAAHECPAITARRARRAGEAGVPQDPIVWAKGRGALIEDVDGNRYLDFTAAFAVSSYGHAHPALVEALSAQAQRLMHGMGDVFPTDVKIAFAARLAQALPALPGGGAPLTQAIFGQSGAEAVEAALKTAMIYHRDSGRRRVLAFHGAYHGLSLGALGVTAYRDSFRAPFSDAIPSRVSHAPYPDCFRCPLGLERKTCKLACLTYTRHLINHPASGAESIGAVILEPIQGRGGEVVPPPEWVEGLMETCRARGVLVILDEIYTGFGRTGRRFAMEHFFAQGLAPDLICLGKAMTGGFPMSAVVGSAQVMGAWGASAGESLHTSTFLGNPMGAAVGMRALDLLDAERYEERAASLGDLLRDGLLRLQARWPDLIGDVRGLGLMLGMDLVRDPSTRAPNGPLSLAVVHHLLQRGVLLMPSGAAGHVLAFSPPFVITPADIQDLLTLLEESFEAALAA